MASLGDFSRRMKIIARGVNENSDKLVRKIAVAVDTTVVLATPVDTGRARSNWRVAIGTMPDLSIIAPYVPGEGNSTGEACARVQIQYAEMIIKGYRGGAQLQPTIFISNNLPYIIPLNNGHSAQAPKAFVEKAVVNGIKMITGNNIINNIMD